MQVIFKYVTIYTLWVQDAGYFILEILEAIFTCSHSNISILYASMSFHSPSHATEKSGFSHFLEYHMTGMSPAITIALIVL